MISVFWWLCFQIKVMPFFFLNISYDSQRLYELNSAGVLAEAPARVHPSVQAAGGAPGTAGGGEEVAGILQRKAGGLRPARRHGVATEACRYWINSVTHWNTHICNTLKTSEMTFMYFPLQAQRCSGEPFPGRRWSRGPNSKLPPFFVPKIIHKFIFL